MTTYFAKKIFLQEGWAENVHIRINKGSLAKLSIEKQKTPTSNAAPQEGGVVVFHLQAVRLGFGILAQPTAACKDLDPTASVVLHQADVGEYLRLESTLF